MKYEAMAQSLPPYPPDPRTMGIPNYLNHYFGYAQTPSAPNPYLPQQLAYSPSSQIQQPQDLVIDYDHTLPIPNGGRLIGIGFYESQTEQDFFEKKKIELSNLANAKIEIVKRRYKVKSSYFSVK